VSQVIATRRERRRPTNSSSEFGIRVEGVSDVMVRLAKCCRPVPGDEIVGYISLGRGITIHRDDCPNARALKRSPERFTPVAWEGEQTTGFKVEIQIDGWDRHRLLEDLSRTFSEAGMNIVEAQCTANPPMIRNRFRRRMCRHAEPQDLHRAAAQHRLGVRRVPGHPRVIGCGTAPRP